MAIGSPPRVRGTDKITQLVILPVRITPACAGNSGCNRLYRPMGSDHPRVCGEQYTTNYVTRNKKGSPPRVRGTERHVMLFRPRLRITPACAGNSGVFHLPVICPADHPRVCGEQVVV